MTPRESWAGRFGFIMATVGFSVGLGNIWRFPYLTGMNGGGAFLLIYLALALLIGIPLFTAEISLGRKTQLTPIPGMRKLTGSRFSPWTLIGWFGVAAALLIMSYYQLIMGWILVYFVRMVGGGFSGMSPVEIEGYFNGLVAQPGVVLFHASVMVLILAVIVGQGLRSGVERAAKLLMPILFVLLVLLAIGGLRFPGAMEGVRWYLAPDFSAVDGGVVLAALGQVFYSIGVGMAAAFVYGSYLNPRDSDVPGGAVTIVGFDVLAAVLAGFVMFPALFAFGISPDVGPGLVFVAMPNLFAQVPAGNLVGAAFFFLLLLAGLTSGIALTEAVSASFMDSLGLSRRRAVGLALGLFVLLGIPSALGFGPWAGIQLFGLGIFDFVDFLSGNVLLPLGGLLIALYTAMVWGFHEFQRETNAGAGRIRVFRSWAPFVRFLIPLAVLMVLVASLGLDRWFRG
jgi:neurotransmitter:Na+ symporter, NSS family